MRIGRLLSADARPQKYDKSGERSPLISKNTTSPADVFLFRFVIKNAHIFRQRKIMDNLIQIYDKLFHS